MKRCIRRVMAMAMAVVMMSGILQNEGAAVVGAAKPRLNKSSLNMKTGDKYNLKVVGKKVTKVKWSSKNKKVATVSAKGLVRAKSKGSTSIYANVMYSKIIGIKLKCTVKVKNADNKSDNKKNVNTNETPVPSAPPVILPTAVPEPVIVTASPVNNTAAPTDTPEPEATDEPEYMQEGAFIYDKLDISWIDPEKPMIAFTFDDGPVGSGDGSNSMRIQKVLRDNGCHATFNYVTSNINSDSNKKEILSAMEDGNEIANHTSQWNSLGDTNNFPDGESIASELEKSSATLRELTGITGFTLRPPNLSTSELVFANCNVPLINCSVDSSDWQSGTTLEQIISNVKKAGDGDIVLMHETNRDTPTAVEELVPYFVEQGYQIVSVVELFAAKNIPLFPGVCYNKAEYKDPRQ